MNTHVENFDEKRNQHPSQEDDAGTAGVALRRVGRDELGEERRANTTRMVDLILS